MHTRTKQFTCFLSFCLFCSLNAALAYSWFINSSFSVGGNTRKEREDLRVDENGNKRGERERGREIRGGEEDGKTQRSVNVKEESEVE